MILGSCGETRETTAARTHGIVALLYAVASVFLAAAVVGEVIMSIWHVSSRGVHLQRAREKGEIA
jgi:hypothetical protein